jgi:hypothetical protein
MEFILHTFQRKPKIEGKDERSQASKKGHETTVLQTQDSIIMVFIFEVFHV